jgi:hypothetical protein
MIRAGECGSISNFALGDLWNFVERKVEEKLRGLGMTEMGVEGKAHVIVCLAHSTPEL